MWDDALRQSQSAVREELSALMLARRRRQGYNNNHSNERAMITCIDDRPGNISIQEIGDLEDFVANHRQEWSAVPDGISKCYWFEKRYPREFKQLKLPVGGAGTGKRITHIEGGFLSNLHLHDINFEKDGTDKLIHSSLTSTNFPLSMFRLRKK